jgi:hypothetical protein
MTRVRRLLALIALALSAAPAPAQPIGGYSLTYTRAGRFGLFSLSVGGYAVPAYGFFGPGYASPSPFVVVQQPVVVVQPPPPAFVVSPRLIVDDDLARDVLPDRFREALGGARLPPREAPPLPPEKQMPGRDAGVFRPLDPDNRDQAARPLQPQPGQQPRRGELPNPPLPEDDPDAEYKRLLGLGKEAFATGEHGRAADRFRQATRVRPQIAEAHFLLTQALLARGKYVAAYAAAVAGLALKPDWPMSGFRPLDLYGANAADYPDHLRRLETAAADNAGDPAILFVHAYALWFDGRQDEARKAFQRALDAGADKDAVARFLRAGAVVGAF